VNIPILSALTLLQQSPPSKSLRLLAMHLYQDLTQGITLHQSLTQHYLHLGKANLNLIKMAENTGTLLTVLTHIIQHREQIELVTKKIRQSLRYPLFLLVISAIIIVGLLLMVIPQFTVLYQQMNSELPHTTRWLLAVSAFLKQRGLPLLMLTSFSLLVLRHCRQKSDTFNTCMHYISYYCPIINRFVKQLAYMRITRCLAISLSAQTPLITALMHAKEAVNHSLFEKKLLFIQNQIREGNSLFNSFLNANCFPKDMIHLIHIAEESGQIAEIFTQIAELSQQHTEQLLQQLSQLMEPLMMLFIGSFIAFILLSLYSPILSLGQVIT